MAQSVVSSSACSNKIHLITFCCYHMQIRVYVGGRDKPFKARVTAIAAEADLAVLSIIGDTTTSSSSSISTSTRVGAAPARGGPKRRRVQGGKAATGRPSTIGAKSKGGSDSSTQQGSAEEEEFWSCMAPLELAPAPPDPQDRVTVQTLPAGEHLFLLKDKLD
jgi:hypothetical protein